MTYIHPTADVSEEASIGKDTYIWQNVQVRMNATIGDNCIIGKGAYIDFGAVVGNKVKIQNYTSVFRGVTIEDGVMVGPHVCFTNDMYPRAVTPEGELMDNDDWTLYETTVGYGAGIGAGSTIVCGKTIGRWAIIGAGSVVAKNVPDHALFYGAPASLKGFVCSCGEPLVKCSEWTEDKTLVCPKCSRETFLPAL